jgi:hypothetical protein
VVFKGSGFHKALGYKDTARDMPVVVESGNDGITFYGITIRDSNTHGLKVSGEGGNSNVTVDNCKFFDVCERMIKGSMGKWSTRVPNMRITNCYFEDTQIPVESDHMDVFNGDYISAIDMMVLDDAYIANNVFVNIKGKNGGGRGAIFIWGHSTNVVSENNVFYNCDRSIAYGNPGDVSVEGGNVHYFVNGGTIKNNTIVCSSGQGVELSFTKDILVCGNRIYCSKPPMAAIEETSRREERMSKGITICCNVIHGNIIAPMAEIKDNIVVN